MSATRARPTLFVLAGPNGAGKTSFYETVLKSRIKAPFINADIIQRDELKDVAVEAAYQAAKIAEERRQSLLKERKSFVMETVFSHPSKLEFLNAARKAGYRIVVFHLNVVSADLAIARVKARVQEGGHPVPEAKIKERYERNQALIKAAVLMADYGAIYDTSALNAPPRLLTRVALGQQEKVSAHPPAWFNALYAGKF